MGLGLLELEPASHEALAFYDEVSREVLLAGTLAVLEGLKWKWHKTPQGAIVAKVPISWKSWGECFRVEVFPREVHVRSQCHFQLFDGGKNRQNVELFLDALDELIEGVSVNEVSIRRLRPVP